VSSQTGVVQSFRSRGLDPDHSVVLFHCEILLGQTAQKTKRAAEAVASGSPTDVVCSYSRSTDCSLEALRRRLSTGLPLSVGLLSVGSWASTASKLPAFGGPTSVTFKIEGVSFAALRLRLSIGFALDKGSCLQLVNPKEAQKPVKIRNR
jgi:hypothetical protein